MKRRLKGSFVLSVQLLLMCSVKVIASMPNTAPGPVLQNLVHEKCQYVKVMVKK